MPNCIQSGGKCRKYARNIVVVIVIILIIILLSTYLLAYLLTYLMQLSFHSAAVVVTLVEKRINKNEYHLLPLRTEMHVTRSNSVALGGDFLYRIVLILFTKYG